MKLEELLDSWKTDCKIDDTDLDKESLDIPLLHGKYLKDFRPTDVITFPADQENELAGEICVSVDQAIDESRSRGIPIAEELSLYLIHGWLHIIGFDDLEQIDREVMRLEEQRVMGYIKKLSLWPDFRLAQNLHD